MLSIPSLTLVPGGLGEVHDEPPLAQFLGNSSQGVGNEVGKWRGGEGASCVSCRALGIQVRLDDHWESQRGAEVAGRTRAVAATVAHPEPPGEALEQVAHEGLVGVGSQEGGSPGCGCGGEVVSSARVWAWAW